MLTIYFNMQRKAINREVAALRAALGCIKKYSLEPDSRMPHENLTKRISTLEMMVQSVELEDEQLKKKPRNSSVSPQGELPRIRIIFPQKNHEATS